MNPKPCNTLLECSKHSAGMLHETLDDVTLNPLPKSLFVREVIYRMHDLMEPIDMESVLRHSMFDGHVQTSNHCTFRTTDECSHNLHVLHCVSV